METNNQALESKYHSKLNGDTLLVVGMLALLVGVEGFIIYRILSETWEIASDFFYLYVIFLGLIFLIETIGCLRVRDSIKNHMFEFKYYD
ncbi:monomethylamine permease [Methanosarcina sp. DH2]|uniref:monomethylamine permease n=1 Tax=unclassified Methanosarcina TaxID=2644672 RepID=UPI001E4507B0|nr:MULTISPECIES: monomethylamine permease [unclassified Methanosarcina]MCC4769731.1 monomethylamine permease [Methanosarcina sp. DH2]MDY9927611.1 monomethylamine permease [Methanosarcina sp.]